MRREHMPLRYMGNFKAVAADYEFYLSLGDKPVSVCLTERQMYILSVWNTYTSWMTRWYNTDDVSEQQLALIGAEIESLLMCMCGVQEPSITDRFTTQNYITNTATQYETTYNTWNTGGQTVSSIAPDLDYSTGVPGDIDKLLCLALDMLIQAIVAAAIANKQGADQPNRDMVKNIGNVLGGLSAAGGAGIAAGGAAAGFVAFLGGPYLVLGLALAAVGMAIANLVWSTDISVFQDDDAIREVTCTISNNLVGATPTRSAFQGALIPNEFEPGGAAEKLAAVIQGYLDDLDTYLQWIATAQGLYDVSDFGVIPDCNCPTDLMCYDFVTGKHGWESIVSPGAYATYFPGEGWGPQSGQFAPEIAIIETIGTVTVKWNMPVTQTALHRTWAAGFGRVAVDNDEKTEFVFTDVDFTSGLCIGVDPGLLPEEARMIEVCYSVAD